MEEQDEDAKENPEQSSEVTDELQEHLVAHEEEEVNPEVPAKETLLSCSSTEAFVDPENLEMEQSIPKLVQENEHIKKPPLKALGGGFGHPYCNTPIN